ncbi:hypothetical protein HanPSC8_Chr13g0580821 [Helianthus annuus]|nr:hypothetical protein HanPSC8_Chr13g0580821 [Helianthus annuus]
MRKNHKSLKISSTDLDILFSTRPSCHLHILSSSTYNGYHITIRRTKMNPKIKNEGKK